MFLFGCKHENSCCLTHRYTGYFGFIHFVEKIIANDSERYFHIPLSSKEIQMGFVGKYQNKSDMFL